MLLITSTASLPPLNTLSLFPVTCTHCHYVLHTKHVTSTRGVRGTMRLHLIPPLLVCCDVMWMDLALQALGWEALSWLCNYLLRHS